MHIAMLIEGVLKSPASEASIQTGMHLYHAFIEVEHRLHLIAEDLDEVTRDWLKYTFIPGYITLSAVEPLDMAQRTLHRTLGKLRATGAIDLVIDPDPVRAADSYRRGYSVMPLLIPAYARPHWRPDYDETPRPWDELATEVDRQKLLAAAQRAAKAAEEN
jgi:DNA-binding transcriptional ArsR family regulator